nr:SusC/RagA family TonB-linked outer membrane protein [uncultured Flavobacterium sp.]
MKQTLVVRRCSVILFVLMSMITYAQNSGEQITVMGTVTDNSGQLIPGVNVTEKSSKNTVTTDYNGKYEIKVKSDATLVFSFIGMRKSEIPLSGRTIVNAKLQEDSNQLESVVVVGYGNQKKSHLTGAVSTVKMSEIEDLPVGDLNTAIQGRVLGVGINYTSNRPGEKSTLTIRNAKVYGKDAGNTNPLYVIDGVLQTDSQGNNDTTLYDNLDASEVESISFLKDGAAAVYGARSAQGVVLITTKRGKVGEPKFTYSGTYGLNDKIYEAKVLSPYEFGKYVNLVNGPSGFNKTDTTNKNNFFNDAELEHFKKINNNVLDKEWSPSYTMRHNLNMGGGTNKATYFAGISYFKQNGNLGDLEYDKYTYRSGVDVNMSSNLKAGFQVSGYYSEKSGSQNKIGGSNPERDYTTLLTRIPYIPMYINSLPVVYDGSRTNSFSLWHYNEFINSDNNKGNNNSNTTVNLFMEYKIPFVKGMSVRGSYARSMSNERSQELGTFYSLTRFKGTGGNDYILDETAENLGQINVTNATSNTGTSTLLFDNTSQVSQQYNFNTNYARDFGKSSVSALFAIERSEFEWHAERVSKTNLSAVTTLPPPTNGTTLTPGVFDDNSYSKKREGGTLGYVGRANYAYADKYLAEFLFRSDASTKFAPENYWGNFYSVSAGWVISKEDFFKSKTIDFLKVRYSVGLLGKDATNAWGWSARYDVQNNGAAVFGGNNLAPNGVSPGRGINRDARWSDEIKTNFGFESKFLDNRMSFGIDSYYNIGTDIFTTVTGNVPFSVGGAFAPVNYSAVDQYGYEVELGWNDNIGNDFKYGIDMRFGWSDDKINKGDFNDLDQLKPWVAKQGKSSDNGVWGYDYLGMFRTQADIDNYVSTYNITEMNGIPKASFKPGMLYYRDVRGTFNTTTGEFAPADGRITSDDLVQLSKKATTQYSIGTTLRLYYKGFSLNAVVNANFGGGWASIPDRGGMTASSTEININNIQQNLPAFWADVFDPVNNPNGKYPLQGTHSAAVASNSVESSFWSVDPFRISCRNINLSYSLPQVALNAIKISSCRMIVTALNPFNLYNPYSYRDVSGSFANYPTLRTISLGLNVGF